MRSYEAARGLYSFMEFCSKSVIGLGVLCVIGALLMSANNASGNMGIVAVIAGIAVGIIVGMGGLFGLIVAQLGRASVDSAEYAQQSLQVAREQLEISRQALAQARTPSESYATSLPSLEIGAVSSGVADSGSPSYRDKAEVAPSSHDASTKSASNTALPKADAAMIENNPDAPLPELSDAIQYENGRYIARGKRFWSQEEAERFLEETQNSPETA